MVMKCSASNLNIHSGSVGVVSFFFFKLAGYRFECLAENLASEDPKHLDVS